MFAVVEIAGMQFEVQPNQKLNVPLLKGNPGDAVEFENVLLAGKDNDTVIGDPYVEGKVTAKIVEHGRGEKVIVFKKKRRKGYRRLKGHKQHYTRIEVTGINI